VRWDSERGFADVQIGAKLRKISEPGRIASDKTPFVKEKVGSPPFVIIHPIIEPKLLLSPNELE
jgi:hypothetical protein